VAMLTVQAGRLDDADLTSAAVEVALADLLERARRDADPA